MEESEALQLVILSHLLCLTLQLFSALLFHMRLNSKQRF